MTLHALHLILISGAPRTGKNRAGSMLATEFNGDHFALSDFLKIETHKFHGLSHVADIFHFENRKDAPCPEFDGKTPRQAYIDHSESILKPKYGQGYLGKLAENRLECNIESNIVSVISGVGFIEEVRPLIATACPSSTFHVRIVNSGPSNQNIDDSRETLNLNSLGVAEIELSNEDSNAFFNSVMKSLEGRFRASP